MESTTSSVDLEVVGYTPTTPVATSRMTSISFSSSMPCALARPISTKSNVNKSPHFLGSRWNAPLRVLKCFILARTHASQYGFRYLWVLMWARVLASCFSTPTFLILDMPFSTSISTSFSPSSPLPSSSSSSPSSADNAAVMLLGILSTLFSLSIRVRCFANSDSYGRPFLLPSLM